MAQKAVRKFSVEKRAQHRELSELEIGDVTWFPRRRNNKLSGKIQRLAEESNTLAKRAKVYEERDKKATVLEEEGKEVPAELEDREIPPSLTQEFNGIMYEQIRLLIRDKQGNSPKPPVVDAESGEVEEEGFLEEWLDIQDAPAALRFVLGQDPDNEEEGEEEGEGDPQMGSSIPAASPTQTSPASVPSTGSSDASPGQTPELVGSEEEDIWADVPEEGVTQPATAPITG